VPEFLRMRFDEKTRALNACSFAVMTVFSSGISMYAMARLIQALHVFRRTVSCARLAPGGNLHLLHRAFGVIVLAYIFLGGLTSAIYNEVLQFFLIIAGFLPLVLLGLRNIGGWAASKHRCRSNTCMNGRAWRTPAPTPWALRSSASAWDLASCLALAIGVLTFLVIQTAMASKNMESARRVPLIAAVPKIFFPFLVILPGLLAIGLPTPHTTTVERNVNGMIVRDTTSSRSNVEEGRGWFRQRSIPSPARPCSTPPWKPMLDYDMATPNMLLHFFPPAFSDSD
jgi:SSS family solute:Na+ symporter